MQTVHKDQLQHRQLKSHQTGELYSFSDVVSDLFKSKQVFLTHDQIAPHQRSSSAHRHSTIEEIVYVVKGELTLQFGESNQTISEGTFIFFDPHDQEFHCLVNQTQQEVETITFSIKRERDVVIYDSQQPSDEG